MLASFCGAYPVADLSLMVSRVLAFVWRFIAALQRRLIDEIFGYDFFISYAHRDGTAYPNALVDELEQRGYRTFLDTRGYVPGDDLSLGTRRRIRMSSQLVVLARAHAVTDSKWVRKEIETCIAMKGTVVVIDFHETLARIQDQALLELLADRLTIRETQDTVPRPKTISDLQRGFDRTRQETIRLRVLWATSLALASFLTVAVAFYIRAEGARHVAEQRRRIAEARLLASEAQAAIEQRPARAVEVALSAVTTTTVAGEAVVPAAEQALRDALGTVGGTPRALSSTPIHRLVHSPDGAWLVASDRRGRIAAWPTDPERETAPVVLVKRGYEVGPFRFTPDGRWLIAAESSHPRAKRLRVWRTNHAAPRDWMASSFVHPDVLTDVHTDGRWLVSASKDGRIRRWSLTSMSPLSTPPVDVQLPHAITAVRLVGTQGEAIAFNDQVVVNESGKVARSHPGLYSTDFSSSKEGPRWRQIGLDSAVVRVVRTTPTEGDDARMYVGYHDGRVQILSAKTGRWLPRTTLSASSAVVDLVPVGPPGRLVVATDDGRVAYFDGDSNVAEGVAGRLLTPMSPPMGRIDISDEGRIRPPAPPPKPRIVVSPDGRWLVTYSLRDTVGVLWDMQKPSPAPHLRLAHGGRMRAAAFSDDGQWLVTGAADQTARVWSLAKERFYEAPRTLRGFDSPVSAVTIDPTQQWVTAAPGPVLDAVAHVEPRMRTWRLDSVTAVAGYFDLPAGRCDAISPDGSWMLTPPTLWSLGSMPRPHPLRLGSMPEVGYQPALDKYWFHAATFDPTSSRLFAWSGLGQIAGWTLTADGADEAFTLDASLDTRELTMRARPDQAGDLIVSLQRFYLDALVSSAPQKFIIADNEGSVLIFSGTKTSTVWHRATLRHHATELLELSHGRLATGGGDGRVRIYQLADLRDPVILSGHHAQGVHTLSADAKNRWLSVIGLNANVVHVYRQAHLRPPDGTNSTTINQTGTAFRTVTTEVQPSRAVFSPAGRFLVLPSSRGATSVDLDTPYATQTSLSQHDGEVVDAEFLDDEWLVSIGDDGRTIFWKYRVGAPQPHERRLSDNRIDFLAVHRGLRRVVTADERGNIAVWTVAATGPSERPVRLSADTDRLQSLHVIKEPPQLVASDGVKTRVWRLDFDAVVQKARHTIRSHRALDGRSKNDTER